MVNTKLLRRKIDERGIKVNYILEKLQLSRQGWANKMENKTEFKVSELVMLKKILCLTEEEVRSIFFAEDVA